VLRVPLARRGAPFLCAPMVSRQPFPIAAVRGGMVASSTSRGRSPTVCSASCTCAARSRATRALTRTPTASSSTANTRRRLVLECARCLEACASRHPGRIRTKSSAQHRHTASGLSLHVPERSRSAVSRRAPRKSTWTRGSAAEYPDQSAPQSTGATTACPGPDASTWRATDSYHSTRPILRSS